MLRALALVSALALVGAVALGDLKLVHKKDNVVSSRIEGRWVADTTLWPRLEPYSKPSATLAFRRDDTVVQRAPQWFRDSQGDREIYSAGMAMVKDKEYPYLLVERDGNPVLIFFRERDGDPMGDGESSLVMLAPAKDTANDILFLGGDFNNEPFRPFTRAKD